MQKRIPSRVRSLSAVVLSMAMAVCSQAGQAAESSPAQVLASDDFRHGLAQWKVEQQDAASVVKAEDGALDVLATAGVTIWYRQPLGGNYELRFRATPLLASFPNYKDRISDLNLFWNARAPGKADGNPLSLNADGSLNAYNPLQLYYVGFGANGNKTTRLRRYDGTPARPQLLGYADAPETTPADGLGALPEFARLKADTPVDIRVVSRAATADDPVTLRFFANDKLVFAYADPAPYADGWFAFRTTTSHFRISDFKVTRQ
ncbi:DUF6250 domain-containing protein [Uliginosibacterium sediminicola]|uniref:DUF6250 domain-containing protein n=1 Tax=Uliginosibacterium sediminicola TaxID=2024550 RepID=A0ABU9YY22_9RHOO